MLSDVCLSENKGFEVLLGKPVCCTCTPRVACTGLLLGLWAERAPPNSNSSRSMALDNSRLPTLYS